MKNTRLHVTGTLAAVLLIGTAAFAVAEVAQSPRASQIPTIVAGASSAASNATIRQSLLNPPAGISSTGKSAADAQPTPYQNSQPAQTAKVSNDEAREVVKQSVRDDGGKVGHNGSEAGDEGAGAKSPATKSPASKSEAEAVSSKTASNSRPSSKSSPGVAHSGSTDTSR